MIHTNDDNVTRLSIHRHVESRVCVKEEHAWGMEDERHNIAI